MKKLNLSKNKQAIIDDEDFIVLSKFIWTYEKSGRSEYASRFIGTPPNRKKIYLHRQILGAKTGQCVDHKNGDGLDNRRTNLRISTKAQNQMNQRKQKNRSSKYIGVSFDKSRNKWVSYYSINKKRFVIGRFENEIDAALARDEKVKKEFKEFASLNFEENR